MISEPDLPTPTAPGEPSVAELVTHQESNIYPSFYIEKIQNQRDNLKKYCNCLFVIKKFSNTQK